MASNVPVSAARMLHIRSLQTGRCWLQWSMRDELAATEMRDSRTLYSRDGRLKVYMLRCSAVLRTVLLLVALT